MQRIYVVDDNPVSALRLSKAVGKDLGATVLSFTDPLQALRASLAEPPDLLLVDYAMPAMSGVKLLQELKRRLPDQDLAAALVSGFSDPLIRSRAFQAGALDVIAKPFDVSEVTLKVRNLLALMKHLPSTTKASEFDRTQISDEWVYDDGGAADVLQRIAAFRSPYSGRRTSRLARYTYVIAKAMGMSVVECEMLQKAVPLHDIGKISLRDSILSKAGALNPQETAELRRHTLLGYDLLKGSKSIVMQLGAEIALNHHEHWDGTGYPRGLKGTDIPLAARIVTICDAFDALTSLQPYKSAWHLGKALKVIRADSGGHFDPEAVSALNRSLPALLSVKREIDGSSALKALIAPAISDIATPAQ